MPSVREVYDAGVALQGAGKIAEAERAYRAVLSAVPNHAEAHNNLGVIAVNRGDVEAACAHYEQALAARPDFPEALNNFATILRSRGEFERAIAKYRSAVELSPRFADALHNLAVTLTHVGRGAEAIEFGQRAVAIQPNFPEAVNTLCIALRQTSRAKDAVIRGNQAVALRPGFADAWNNLGLALHDLRKFEEAVAAFKKALELQPIFPEASHNLAMAFYGLNRFDQAVQQFEKTLEHMPSSPETLANLGLALAHFGRLDEAIACYAKSLSLRPDPVVAGNWLYTIAQHPSQDVVAIREAHEAWSRQYADPLKPRDLHFDNDRSPTRRLRIGYVSPDFHQHPVGRFMLPLLGHHDAGQFEIYCYNESLHPDDITKKLQSHATHWRNVHPFSDEILAQQIRKDRIDILVDLAMHLRRNRMLCFARKPAPIQVTYLAYLGTTGLSTIDYRLTDAYLDPPGSINESYVEKSAHLRCYWCFQPLDFTPPVSTLPALEKNYVTFGSLNNFSKVTEIAVETWRQILDRVPNSRLLLYVPDGEPRKQIRARFGDRINFLGFSDTAAYLRAYDHVDIALDTFPIVGGTTTCDALWMGTPVVTLPGKTAITRSGLSILHNAGCPEWIADSRESYIEIAVALSSDLEKLAEIRATLRDRLSKSLLMDAVACTRDLEKVYRQMWMTWAGSPATSGASNV